MAVAPVSPRIEMSYPPSLVGGVVSAIQPRVRNMSAQKSSKYVGRPVVQKLHGANATVGAQEMMVVTTSSFTQGAVDYAARTGVHLIDGTQLLSLCRRAWPSQSSPLSFPTAEAWLTDDDIMARIPMDLWARYR